MILIGMNRFIDISNTKKYQPSGIIIIPLDTRNTYTMRVKEPQWMNEVEQLGLLLNSVNRMAQIDRSLYFSPRNAGDTLFNLASLKS